MQDSSIIAETIESDFQEGTSIAIEEMGQLETELVAQIQNNSAEEGICSIDAQIQNNSGEEGICSIDALKSMPEPQVGLAVEQELVLETRNNSAEEGICSIGAPTSTPDPQVSLTMGPNLVLEIQNNNGEEGICSVDSLTSAPFGVTVDMHEQPYGRYGFFY